MKLRSRAIALAAFLGAGVVLTSGIAAQQQPVPDAPIPQAPAALPGGPVTPGLGGPDTSSSSANSNNAQPPAQPDTAPAPPPSQPSVTRPPVDQQTTPPEEGSAAMANFVMQVNEVVVPVTVKDTKGNPVSGLTWRDFTDYENTTKETIRVFSVDPAALSLAFVIDQTLPSNIMDEVNQSMGAIQGALTPYDEAAVFSYTHFTKEWTGFTGGQSSRLPAVLSLAQSAGTDPTVPINEGDPFAVCSISINGNCPDPNLNQGHSVGGQFTPLPKEVHALNDAILAAAKELASRPKERRRVIYVISDGKEYGSKATFNEVKKYLQTNNITVYATVVGDSARFGQEWLDRFHLPFEMYDNILYKYTSMTGGDMFFERGTSSMEKSYAKLAGEARNQYTLLYLSHESIYDGKYRSIDVRVDRPNVIVTAKPGYYPSAQEYK
ncbi:MAG: VWA domain-containing protein [Terracidiphilus sp.]